MEATGQLSVQERYAMIAALPRPRPVRRSPVAGPAAVAVVTALKLVALGLIANILWSLRDFISVSTFFPGHKGSFFGLGFVAVAIAVTTTAQRKQKNLVINGEVSIATITGRYQMNNDWHVRYTFRDKNGQEIMNDALDNSGKRLLVSGQQMLVYYQPENPRKAVAQSESWYEPSVTGMERDPRF
jgi:Protein of unknown function (DUF3592)